MAKKKRIRRKRNLKIPVAATLGLAAGIVPPLMRGIQKGQWEFAMQDAVAAYTGYNMANGTWSAGNLTKGLIPAAIGAAVSQFVGGYPLNMNRKLRDIPFIKI